MIENLLDSLSKMKISSIYLYFELKKNSYLFFSSLLSLPNIQKDLKMWHMTLQTLSDAFLILDLLSKWTNIENISLYYSSSESISNPKEKIREYKESFYFKSWVLLEWRITHLDKEIK